MVYLHVNNIVHCDLKLENFLYEQKDSNFIKLIDFGLAARLQTDCFRRNGDQLTTVCGTPAMCAPEIWSSQERAPPMWKKWWGKTYGSKVDVYAAGVVLYLVMLGKLPFASADTGALAKKVCDPREHPPFESRAGHHQVSQACKDCISTMLEKDPTKRASALQASRDPWLQPSPRRTRGLPTMIPLEVRAGAAADAQAALVGRGPTPQETWERSTALAQARIECELDDSSSDEDTC